MILFCFGFFSLPFAFAFAQPNLADLQVEIPGGSFVPFDLAAKSAKQPKVLTSRSAAVASFSIDKLPVTNKDFLAFVKVNPEWRRSQIKKIIADSHYLQDWSSDLSLRYVDAASPVTRVSWFAATAYCESLNKTLPTTEQWEYALYNHGRQLKQTNEKILAWYGKPNQKLIPHAGSVSKNDFGVHDLGTSIWEWTEDFNSFLSATDMRSDGKDSNLFCGSGSQMGNPNDYAAFMRYSFRASLQANYTTANLGFRCARKNELESAK